MPGLLKTSLKLPSTSNRNTDDDSNVKIESKEKMEINITVSPGNHLIVITCYPDTTMDRFKKACTDVLNVDGDDVYLDFNGRSIEDDDTPEKLGMTCGDTITLFVDVMYID